MSITNEDVKQTYFNFLREAENMTDFWQEMSGR